MAKFKTHFCMVSGQAAPNLLPLLDDAIKPEKVVLLTTDAMKAKADFLESVIKPRGIQVIKRNFVVSDSFENMQDQIMGLISEESAADIALNATGGTKWMAIAAQEVFRMNGSAVFYVKVEDDKVLFLDKERPAHDLSHKIDLRSYIQAYGYEFKEPSQPEGLAPNLRVFCQTLVEKADEWQSAIGALNQLAAEADNNNTLSVGLKGHADKNMTLLLKECEAAGLLKQKGNSVVFSSEEARTLANGGWLESYVNSLLNALKGENIVQDAPRLNLHIQRIGATSHNEVDVCFMAKNRLHLIECKTKRMSGKGTSQMTTDTVYKLDSISELGGLASKAMLVSYRKVSNTDKRRAKDLNIKVVEAAQLKNLKAVLRDWIQQ